MVRINCTKKLINRLHPSLISGDCESSNVLGAWCANVFDVERAEFVLFTNEKTLLSTMIPSREFGNATLLLNSSIYRQLYEARVSQNAIESELSQYATLCYSASTNRHVIGSMNDLVYQIRCFMEDRDQFKTSELERAMSEIPFSMIKYKSAGEMVKELFAVPSPA